MTQSRASSNSKFSAHHSTIPSSHYAAMLKRLYSPTGLLIKDIEFKDGINLVIGEYGRADRPVGNNNGIGKSSVVRLIDYLLLSNSAARFFSQEKYEFLREEGHLLCLELQINNALLVISRNFDTKKKLVTIKHGDQIPHTLPLAEAVSIFSDLFFPQEKSRLLPGNRYGSLMTFFIKDDLESLTRKGPVSWLSHAGASERELGVLNLFLMGISNDHLVLYNDTTDLIVSKRKFQKELIKQAESTSGKRIVALRAEIGTRESKLKLLQEAFDKFDFFEDFKQVSNEIVLIGARIKESRKQLEQLNRQLTRIRGFATATREVDIDDLTFQYAQVSSALGNMVKRSLKDVISFRESLAEERLKFHAKSLSALELQKSEALTVLEKLERDRGMLYRVLDEAGVSEPLRGAMERIASERISLEKSQHLIQQISDMDRELDNLGIDAGNAKREFLVAVEEADNIIRALQEIFVEVVTDALAIKSQNESDQAYLDISRSVTRNGSPIHIEASVPRIEALGNDRMTLVAYDFTVFLHALQTSIPLPRFLIHDGVFHGISRASVLRALNYIHRRLAGLDGAQYIVTFNQEELPRMVDSEMGNIAFQFDISDATILTLHDTPEKMLFKRKI